MEFNEQLVDKLASKLLIGLTPEENKMVLDEFKLIEKNMDLINNIKDIKSQEPITHPYDLFTATFREDEAKESESFKDVISNCDDYDGREIRVPKTVI